MKSICVIQNDILFALKFGRGPRASGWNSITPD